jgi:hypothetical protein
MSGSGDVNLTLAIPVLSPVGIIMDERFPEQSTASLKGAGDEDFTEGRKTAESRCKMQGRDRKVRNHRNMRTYLNDLPLHLHNSKTQLLSPSNLQITSNSKRFEAAASDAERGKKKLDALVQNRTD